MTDIAVTTTAYTAEQRGWIASPHGVDMTPGITLDISKFTAGTHHPTGVIPSGTVLGKVTATGLYGPYDSAAVDGRNAAVGFLFSSVPVRTGSTKVGSANFVHGLVRESRLPFSAGPGALDAAARIALKLIALV